MVLQKKFKSAEKSIDKKKKDDGNNDAQQVPDCSMSSTVKAHDGEKLHVGQWVAVAYNEDFYVGQVTNILSNNGGVKIKFLTKKKDGFYKWLQLKDTDLVSTEYIFHSKPAVQKVGSAFVLNDENMVINLYDSYKKKYLTS